MSATKSPIDPMDTTIISSGSSSGDILDKIGTNYNGSVGVVIAIFVLAIYFYSCWKYKTKISESAIVELIAYSTSVYGAGTMIAKTFVNEDSDSLLILFTGAILICVVSVRGIVRAINSKQEYEAM